MKTFYCNKCEKDIELINGKCPICKIDWISIIQKFESSDATNKS